MKTKIKTKTKTKTKTKVPRPPPGERAEPTLGFVLARSKDPKEAISNVRPSEELEGRMATNNRSIPRPRSRSRKTTEVKRKERRKVREGSQRHGRRVAGPSQGDRPMTRLLFPSHRGGIPIHPSIHRGLAKGNEQTRDDRGHRGCPRPMAFDGDRGRARPPPHRVSMALVPPHAACAPTVPLRRASLNCGPGRLDRTTCGSGMERRTWRVRLPPKGSMPPQGRRIPSLPRDAPPRTIVRHA
eukprot:scaffold1982_cov358-Pavlova_lutheri.AAC.15